MKTNPEFDNFTNFMDKLAKVPHSEVKTELDKELEDKAERRAARLAKLMGPVHMSGVEDDPLLRVANEVFQKAARRKVN